MYMRIRDWVGHMQSGHMPTGNPTAGVVGENTQRMVWQGSLFWVCSLLSGCWGLLCQAPTFCALVLVANGLTVSVRLAVQGPSGWQVTALGRQQLKQAKTQPPHHRLASALSQTFKAAPRAKRTWLVARPPHQAAAAL